jgi:hypothetical protein
LSTTAASLSGTLAVTGTSTLSSALTVTGGTASYSPSALPTPTISTTTTGAINGAFTSLKLAARGQAGQDQSIAITNVPTADGDSAIALTTYNAYAYSEKVRITSAGNVGIGTSTPDTLLTLGTTARTDNTAGIKIFRGGGSASYATYGFAGNAVINSVGGDLVIQRESSERARFTTEGLCFNGDFAAANALDDYEEGTWTMGVSFGGASVDVTYANNTGTYTKVGRKVTVNGYLGLSSKGSSTGAAVITGLPFAIPNVLGNYAAASVYLDKVAFANQYQAIGNINTANVGFSEITEAGAVSALNDADFANNSEIIINFTYLV